MKYLFFLLSLAICACSDSSGTGFTSANGHDFAKSRGLWLQMKAENGDSYRYTTSYSSFSGYRWVTTITVRDGQITERSMVETLLDMGVSSQTDSYMETGSDIGSHAKGAVPRTIDDLYEICGADVLTIDPDQNTITWQTYPDGLLQICSYFPINCADDCSTGVNIGELVWL